MDLLTVVPAKKFPFATDYDSDCGQDGSNQLFRDLQNSMSSDDDQTLIVHPPPALEAQESATAQSGDADTKIATAFSSPPSPAEEIGFRQRSMSDGRGVVVVVPSPIHISDDVRTFANPLSYLGGPRLLTANLSRASKESVLSIDE